MKITTLNRDMSVAIETGPVSLVASALWGNEARPDLLGKVPRYVDSILEKLALDRPILSVDVSRIKNVDKITGAARTMISAASSFPEYFATPLIAVAGTVADYVADFITKHGANWVVVSNGGDVALRLGDGRAATVGLRSLNGKILAPGRVRLWGEDGVGGVATSGFGGRSFTLGIADSVTVLAARAATADVAATLIANEVNVDSQAIERIPANEICANTDLADKLVTVSVGELDEEDISLALDRGAAAARAMIERGSIKAALLSLKGRTVYESWPRLVSSNNRTAESMTMAVNS